MRRLLSLVPLILMASTSSWATNWYPSQNITQMNMQPLRCPTVGKDFSQMISQLDVLQDKIKADANCGKLVENFEQIKYLSGDRRQEFLAAIEKINAGETLNDLEMERYILTYAEDVTVASASLATLLSQANQCFGKQDMNASLSTLSSFVNEASTLLSTVAGPWGPALSIGGKVVSGFLTGVNKFIQSLPGYDFNDKKEWQGYVETLCSFHEQQDEIYALIHPDKAIDQLARLKALVNSELDKTMSADPQNADLLKSFENEDNDALFRISEGFRGDNDTLGLKTVRLLTARKWILNRIRTIESEAQDPLAPGQYLVQKQRDEIENFLIYRQGPKFINFQVSEARTALANLNLVVNSDALRLYRTLISLDPSAVGEGTNLFPWVNPDVALKALMTLDVAPFHGKGLAEERFVSELQYFKRNLANSWDALNLAYGVKSSFCEFFQKASYYNSGIAGSCNSGRAFNIEKEIKNFESMGFEHYTPAYLRKSAHYQGANWTESLEIWVNQLD
ncbi:MAG TPA: hypothetical protein DCL41_03865 [Bdellovibrionales bacterium]|nr:hypothetical protein [Pseudobdellovibrionaceae bacterium]HAG90979.1 hypothetical protein [Bdellovibrionales bacterium]|tara:strand:- start:5466 stop:6989 length:1524 start_codon:yes stop_codon:yes gene_type:complete